MCLPLCVTGYLRINCLLKKLTLINNFYVRSTLIAEIQEDTGLGGSAHLVAWCPYIPDEDDDSNDEDVAKMLLSTHSNVGM